MSVEFIYFLKINIALTLFYAFYRSFCRKDTFFQWRRTVMLLFLLISFIYPFFNIQEWIKEQDPIYDLTNIYATAIIPEITISAESLYKTNFGELLINILTYVYLIGVSFLLARFVIQLISICLVAFQSKKATINGITIKIPKTDKGPFSFFGWIFITPQSFPGNELDEILIHEQTHVRQHHSIDVVLSELACIICWINPFCWSLKREIRNNLEYMADNKVIESGYDSKNYQYHLLGLAHQNVPVSLYNNFNVLSLKNRIMMMNKKRTKNIGRSKYLIFFLLSLFLLLVSNMESIARTASEITKEIIQNLEVYNHTEETEVPQQNKEIIEFTSESNKELAETPVTAKESTYDIQADNSEYTSNTTTNNSSEVLQLNPSTNLTSSLNKKERAMINIKDFRQQADEKEIFMVVEQMPEYPGGIKECLKFLGSHIRYPEKAMKDGIEGRVIAQFVVEADGTVSNPKIVRSVSPELDEETIRIINSMPKWKPGMQRGKAVKVNYTIPVTFKLKAMNNESELQPGQIASNQALQ